jgi:hypothetical protein
MKCDACRRHSGQDPSPRWQKSPHCQRSRHTTFNVIPQYFGAKFNSGSWNSGIVIIGQNMILLVTLEKGNLAAGNEYADHFINSTTFQWQSQNRTTVTSRHGRIINGSLPGYLVHLFVRPSKLRGTGAAPFIYCGSPAFQSWEGEKPITVVWKLPTPVPSHLRRPFNIDGVADSEK